MEMAGRRMTMRNGKIVPVARPFREKGEHLVAYVPCNACKRNHKGIPQAELVKLVIRYQDGDGQLVTGFGIESRCILDVLEVPHGPQRKSMENEGKREYITQGQRRFSEQYEASFS